MEHNTSKTKPMASDLPVMVTSPADVGRLLRELETIDDVLLSQTLRKSGGKAKMLKASQLMDQTAELNKLNLLHKTDRQKLQRLLQGVKDHAPILHMSFSADPSPAFLEKLMIWLRREIDPHVLITIGLQPTIGAGCIVRSTSRYFDFSLRQDFAKKHNLLMDKLTPATKDAQQ